MQNESPLSCDVTLKQIHFAIEIQLKPKVYKWNIDISSLLVFLKMAIPGLFFFIFVFLIQLTINVQYNFLTMTGFKRSTN